MWHKHLLSVVGFAAFCLVGCQTRQTKSAAQFAGGSPEAGREKIAYYGCSTCHEIPGIRNAKGRVGPSLRDIADQTYLAGALPNTPQNMSLWIQKPREVEPHTAMPDMGVSDQDARDITAYLYLAK